MAHYCDAGFQAGLKDTQDPVCYGDYLSPFNDGFAPRNVPLRPALVWPEAQACTSPSRTMRRLCIACTSALGVESSATGAAVAKSHAFRQVLGGHLVIARYAQQGADARGGIDRALFDRHAQHGPAEADDSPVEYDDVRGRV